MNGSSQMEMLPLGLGSRCNSQKHLNHNPKTLITQKLTYYQILSAINLAEINCVNSSNQALGSPNYRPLASTIIIERLNHVNPETVPPPPDLHVKNGRCPKHRIKLDTLDKATQTHNCSNNPPGQK